MIVIVTILMVLAETVAVVHQAHEDKRHAETVHRTVTAGPNSPAQSWDQENLKRDDHGCPTAIYVAPNGNLEQCQ